MIRVFVAARSTVVRAGFEALVKGRSPDWILAGSGELPSDAPSGSVDVILTDADGDDPVIFDPYLAPAVVLGDDAAEALRAGARGFLRRDATEREVFAAVEAAAAGLSVVPAKETEALLAVPESPDQTQAQSTLTPREIEVLRLLAEGDSNKIIAWKLSISEHTVKFHLASLFDKLKASTRTEAVMAGIRQGLIPL